MGDLLSTILHELKQATGATKTLAGIVAATVLAMIGVAAVVSSHADFQPAFSELSAPEMSGVSKALADAGISFEVSQPPGPFVVFVDNGDRSAAMAAAYSSGALDKPIGGIISDTGAGSLFLGNEERRQAVRKREWQEAEGILETLDFVMSAKVTTSPGDPRPLLGRPAAPTTASVTLRLIGSQPMTSAQFGVVSRLVSRGLGVKPGDLIVSDQSGTFYDGAEENETDVQLGDRLAYQQDYNQRLAGEVDAALARALGPDMAYVMIQSEWDFDQSVTRSETAAKGA
ncbi:MAG: flagellar biosynthesis/type III secretory pathway M-ring protein FliF/YscJ, partial [Gammaproteobacteria bacterium]